MAEEAVAGSPEPEESTFAMPAAWAEFRFNTEAIEAAMAKPLSA